MKATLKKLAYAHDGVAEEVSCAGTPIESTKYTVNKKAFLFVGGQEPLIARLKLDASIDEASKRAPNVVNVGAGGWTKLTFVVDDAIDAKTLARWIDESYSLFASNAKTATPKKKIAKKPAAKKAKAKRTR